MSDIAAVGRSVSWSVIGRLGSQGVQFVSGLILVRMLAPADFGVMAAVYAVAGFATLFFELGLSATLVHLEEPSSDDYSTAFWINAIGGCVLTALLWIMSAPVSEMLDQPRLKPLLPLVGLVFTLYLGVCHQALLERELAFRRIAGIQFVATLVGWCAAIIGAVLGLGIYALALEPLVRSVLTTFALWRSVRWRPTSFISKISLRRLWRFSGGLFGFNVATYMTQNADTLALSRATSAASLGYYNRAFSLMLLPVQQVQQVLLQVMFPTLARMRADEARFREAYRRALRAVVLCTAPVLAAIAASSPAVVNLLWGRDWMGAARPLTILCFAGVGQCVTGTTTWVFQALGRTVTQMWIAMLRLTLLATALVFLTTHGRTWVAVAVLIASWAPVPVYVLAAASALNSPCAPLLADILRPLGVAVFTFACTFAVNRLVAPGGGASSLVVACPVALVSLSVAARLLLADVVDDLWVALKPARGEGQRA